MGSAEVLKRGNSRINYVIHVIDLFLVTIYLTCSLKTNDIICFRAHAIMKKTRSWRTFILLVMTTCLCFTIFVYLDLNKMHFLKDISPQTSAATDNVYSRMEYMDRDDPNESNVNTRRKYSKDLFLEKVLEYRLLLPLKGHLFNPVVRKVVEQLKQNDRIGKYVRIETIDEFAKSHLRPRDTTLSASDLKKVQNCKTTSKKDYLKSYKSLFEGNNGRSRCIRRTHHIYLNSTSFMIEVGGNWGWDAGNFSNLYNMNCIILEPLTPYTDILQRKFYGNEKISVYNIGLGSKNEVVMVNLEGINACATTKFSRKNGTVPIYIVNAIDFMTHLGM